ncbi:MAG: hypothetical protein PHO02_04850 [Candidatus Nanoarchaeia archaeon]|nr:hypothetical protein [Candidatus Nanoarchaeia archaeon]
MKNKLAISLTGATIGSAGLYFTALGYTFLGAVFIGAGGILIALGTK